MAVASSIAITGHALTLGLLWRRVHTSEGLEGLPRTVLQVVAATAAAAFGGRLAADAVAGGRIPDFATGLAATAAGLGAVAVIYLVTTMLTGSVEARTVVRRRLLTRWR